MTKKKNVIPSEKLDLYNKLIQTNPAIEAKGSSTAYTSHNGHMFTYLSKDGELGIRLPQNNREAFLMKYKTTLLEQYGKIMKEYVKVPEALLNNTLELEKYLDISYEYVKSLKPK